MSLGEFLLVSGIIAGIVFLAMMVAHDMDGDL